MIELDDPRWRDLHGGYRVPYDASIALRSLANGTDVWPELWEELHHQYDVDVASYAAAAKLIELAPQLAARDWNFYSLIAVIEVQRHRRGNPPIPAWLLPHYQSAWQRLVALALADFVATTDKDTIQAILSVLALAKGSLKLGALMVDLDTTELDELLEERADWTESYRS